MTYGGISNLPSGSSYCCYNMATESTREIRENALEIKFEVDPDTAARIRQRARSLFTADPWAAGPHADEYQTSTLYFDTEDYKVYQRKGSYRRAKHRVRRYGAADLVFLERKLRTPDLVSKRRTTVRCDDLPLLTAGPHDAKWEGRWFQERLRLRKLGVVCQVIYRRTARVGMTDYGPFRLTIDEDLRASATNAPEFHETEGIRMTEKAIVEMKFRAVMPTLLKQVVEEFALRPARVSKYRLAIEAARPEVVASIASEITAAKAPNA